jgi:hypothetical protein
VSSRKHVVGIDTLQHMERLPGCCGDRLGLVVLQLTRRFHDRAAEKNKNETLGTSATGSGAACTCRCCR